MKKVQKFQKEHRMVCHEQQNEKIMQKNQQKNQKIPLKKINWWVCGELVGENFTYTLNLEIFQKYIQSISSKNLNFINLSSVSIN